MSRKIWAAEQAELCNNFIIELDNLFVSQISELKRMNNIHRDNMSKEEFEKLKALGDKYLSSREKPQKILKVFRNFVARAARERKKPIEGEMSV